MADFCHVLTMSKNGANELANRWFQPLTHVSARGSPRDSAICCQRGTRGKRGQQRFATTQRVAQSVRRAFSAKGSES